jgi:hypothetical protein
MNTKDPVVHDITKYINRSAGQHQRRVSEGADRRVIDLKVVDTMTDDRLSLHRVDTSQMSQRDGVSVGGCCTHECNEGRDCPQRIEFAGGEPYSASSLALAVAVVGVLGLVLWHISPELRGLIYIITN